MSLGVRVLLGFFLLVAIGGWCLLAIVVQEVKPGVRRATEEGMVDQARLLAELVSADLGVRPPSRSALADSALAQAFAQVHAAPMTAQIDHLRKQTLDTRVYVTDAQGIVIFDSSGRHLGADFSRWNDVYLTLRGQYGARSSRDDPDDESSSVMYVAAPLRQHGAIVGVLTVAKPNRALAPVITRSERKLQWTAFGLLATALLVGTILVWWLNRSIHRLEAYAHAVRRGEAVSLPELDSPELARLGSALEQMRRQLDGKAYVEQYVHSLTHELKSPLAAARAAGELLLENPPPAVAQRFVLSIGEQVARMQHLIDRLLQLASLESRPALTLTPQPVATLVEAQVALAQAAATRRQQQIACRLAEATVAADGLLLGQAIASLLDNALDFAPEQGTIQIAGQLQDGGYLLTITDDGPGIPDYALCRLFERFYSLPRPQRGKSSGLGLSFVREVVERHQGRIQLDNRPDGHSGACARLWLPLAT
ncbi:two-component system sensor histidine kinase CreC [Pseudaeromonas sharmana]|uniref:histidine kinase n=1 Tax=Pseudaeromonas sharmana TaxID=328412 RepID=A0ABV8CM03_9GAMM